MISPFRAILDVIFPSMCASCGRVLVQGERQICVHCILELTPLSSSSDNLAERRLLSIPSLQAAAALYQYNKGTASQRVVHAMKFHGNTELCLQMGNALARHLVASGRFDDVDVFVPVPLHPLRRFRRGYNQSALLCKGMAEVWERPVIGNVLYRRRYTRKQSRSKSSQRASNVDAAFAIHNEESLIGKHLLLVDDVMTTGSTILSCTDVLQKIPGVKISVATLCLA